MPIDTDTACHRLRFLLAFSWSNEEKKILIFILNLKVTNGIKCKWLVSPLVEHDFFFSMVAAMPEKGLGLVGLPAFRTSD